MESVLGMEQEDGGRALGRREAGQDRKQERVSLGIKGRAEIVPSAGRSSFL